MPTDSATSSGFESVVTERPDGAARLVLIDRTGHLFPEAWTRGIFNLSVFLSKNETVSIEMGQSGTIPPWRCGSS